MKIALSLDQMSPGGGPKFMLNLGQYLVATGHAVTIVTETKGAWWPELAASGLVGICLPTNPGASIVRRAQQLANYWNRQHFDVIVVNVNRLNRLAQCASHLVADDTAVLLVLHGDWPELYSLAAKDMRAWNCAVGVSPKVHEGAAIRLPHKPVFGIANGIELPTAEQLQLRLDWELPLRLLFVGRLIDAHKGIFRLPKILAACRERNLPVRLTVVGDGEDGQRLAQRFAEEGVVDLVDMVGMQPPATIGAAMRRHHLLVFPTNTEGMPLVVLEAQANGCVVITTALPGITDVALEDQVTGRLAALGNIEQFVDHIEAMLTPTVWQSHSQAAVVRSHRLFSLAGMGEQYGALLESLVQGAYPIKRPYNQSHKLSDAPFTLEDYLPPRILRYLSPTTLRRARRIKHRLGRIAARAKLVKRKPAEGVHHAHA
ncbi:hypothetical protein BH10CHL1_BH10CHL1_40800 [soil metagenome]